MPPEVHRTELKAGALIASQYVLERALGAGGMGVVWAAETVSDRSKVALKFLRGDRAPSERACQRFLQEARATRTIGHPGVVQIHDVVEDGDGLPVLVMDLLMGETLASRLERKGPMPAPEAIALLLPAAAAVAAAHDQRIIHRDLKPENLFLCAREGQAPELRVLDFGIAKVMRGEADGSRSGLMTSTGVVLGTPFYMSPEQLFSERDIDERADVWAFGVILYECIAGRRPFVGPSVGQVLRLIALDEYTPLAQAAANEPPASVCDLVARLLARDPSGRPRTMREVELLLQQIVDGTYECSLPFATTLRLSQTSRLAETIDPANPLRPPSSGVDLPLSSSANDSSGVRTERSVRARRARALGLGLGVVALLAALVGATTRLRTADPGGAAPSAAAQQVPAAAAIAAPAKSLPPVSGPPPSAIASGAAAPSAAATPATPSAAWQGKPVAAHLSAPRSVAHGDAGPPAAAAPEVSTTATEEPARRPGSVVDRPPF